MAAVPETRSRCMIWLGRPTGQEREVLGMPGAAEAVEGDQDRARALWALAHGLTLLELDGRFPGDADIDAAWKAGLTQNR